MKRIRSHSEEDKTSKKIRKVTQSLKETRALLEKLDEKEKKMRKEIKKERVSLLKQGRKQRQRKLKYIEEEERRIVKQKDIEEAKLTNLLSNLPKELCDIIIMKFILINPSIALCSKYLLESFHIMIINNASKASVNLGIELFFANINWRIVGHINDPSSTTEFVKLTYNPVYVNEKILNDIHINRIPTMFKNMACSGYIIRKIDDMFKRIEDFISTIKITDYTTSKKFQIDDPKCKKWEVFYRKLKSRQKAKYVIKMDLKKVNEWIPFDQLHFILKNMQLIAPDICIYSGHCYTPIIRYYNSDYDIFVCIQYL